MRTSLLYVLLLATALQAACSSSKGPEAKADSGGPTCTDRNGVSHPAGPSWTDGCQTCSCGDLGTGKLEATCSHNACPPDASADTSTD